MTLTPELQAHLAGLPGRCPELFDIKTQHGPGGCPCPAGQPSEWSTFVSALRSVRREDGTVHQGDMRPRIRGVIQPSKIGQLYRKARDGGLIADTGEREPSNDAAGRNLDKLDRIYRWVDAA